MDLTPVNIPSTDGWIKDIDTWTYASATTFTIAGKDVTARFPIGTKIKLTQTTAKYFYVVSAAFSTDTTVTITGGSDYSLVNAAITSPYYSYQATPQGFPQWFNYSETWTGFSSSPSGNVCRFKIDGRTVTQCVSRLTGGTSNANTCEVSLVVAARTLSGYFAGGWALGVDNGVTSSSGYRWYLTSGFTTAKFTRNESATGWTTSGTKNAIATLTYEI